MSEGSTQIQEAPEATPPSATPAAPAEVKQVSPAQDLRDIQMLLVGGIFPGNMAPMVVKAYQMLEAMASQVEKSVESK